jgi:hypothetical protein
MHTKVASAPRSVVTPTCSLPQVSAHESKALNPDILCNSQKVVPVYTLVIDFFVILAYSTSIHHVVASLVNLGI